MAILKSTGPTALNTTMTTNVYAPAGNEVIRNIHVVNKTASAATFSLWIGATGANAAGTEFFSAQSVPANSVYDWPFPRKLTAASFVVGGASANTTLTIDLTTEVVAS